MRIYLAKRDPRRKPLHPGELLREDIIPALGKPKAEIARLLAQRRVDVSRIPTLQAAG